MKLRVVAGFAAFALIAAACGDNEGNSLETRQECNPLGGLNCITPWPSALYATDADTATGRQLNVPEGALPTNTDGIPINPALINDRDGFSSAAPIIMAFAEGVDPSNLVNNTAYEDSVTEDSPTILIDMDSGELVHHFAELDFSASDLASDKQALYIRPAQMLPGSTRFAVAIRRTLKAADGSDIAIPEGYQAILDGKITNHTRLEAVRPRYDEIFAALEAHGIDREDLITAWDFTTASRASMRADVQELLNIAMPAMGSAGSNLSFAVDKDEPNSDPRIARRIDGTFDSPLFLTEDGRFTIATKLARDEAGGPQMQGMWQAPFTAIIPECAVDGSQPGPVGMFIYGHGLLGTSDQVASGAIRDLAAELCMVGFGTDMRGMSERDVANVANTLNDLNKGALIFDGLVQGIVDHVALVEAARGPMAQTLFVDDNGNSIVDTSKIYYHGISQGGIFGGTHCAWSPVIEKCVLQVNGINYSMMLERSLDWPVHRTTLVGAYPDALDVAINLHLMQMFWDKTDPVSVADVLLTPGEISGTPAKQVLMEIAIGDDEVANISSDYQVRTMGLPVLAPAFHTPFGTTAEAGPLSSAFVAYDFGVGDTVPLTNTPPPENEVHSLVRKQRSHIEMMRTFLETGEIVQTCTGENGCSCTTDACGGEI